MECVAVDVTTSTARYRRFETQVNKLRLSISLFLGQPVNVVVSSAVLCALAKEAEWSPRVHKDVTKKTFRTWPVGQPRFSNLQSPVPAFRLSFRLVTVGHFLDHLAAEWTRVLFTFRGRCVVSR